MKVSYERAADIGLISITEPYSGSLKTNGSIKRGAYTFFFIGFGMFGNDNTPTIMLHVDVFNETLSESNFKVPSEVENLVSCLSYECNMNKWATLTDAQPQRFR